MPEFISKIQYKICEKGEFFDEQPRSLDETLAIIKSFPWDVQRGADVQLSGPGVVIKNEAGAYLKVALYFNGKFSIYYLDAGDYLYEYHTPDLIDECQKVQEFFEGNLNLERFDKHFFNIGNKAHFITRSFEYRINPVKEYFRISSIGVMATFYFVVICFAAMQPGFPIIFAVLFLCVAIFLLFTDAMTIKVYTKAKNLSITISKGADNFLFNDGAGPVKYLKSDILELNIYGEAGGRNKQILTIMELIFKNGATIKFPGMLIDPLEFLMKLPEDVKRNNFKQNTFYRKSVWEY